MVHVGLHSVAAYHKKFGWQNNKIKIYFAECPRKALGKACSTVGQRGGTPQPRFLGVCQDSALGKDNDRQL
jgi:hypothetical protein